MCSGQRVIVEDKIEDQVVHNVVTIQVKKSLMDFLYKNCSHCALILILEESLGFDIFGISAGYWR